MADLSYHAARRYSQKYARTTAMTSLTQRLPTGFLSSTVGDTVPATKNKLVLNYLQRKLRAGGKDESCTAWMSEAVLTRSPEARRLIHGLGDINTCTELKNSST